MKVNGGVMCACIQAAPRRRTIECVLLLLNVFSYYVFRQHEDTAAVQEAAAAAKRVCQNVFSYYRMCFLTVECVLLL